MMQRSLRLEFVRTFWGAINNNSSLSKRDVIVIFPIGLKNESPVFLRTISIGIVFLVESMNLGVEKVVICAFFCGWSEALTVRRTLVPTMAFAFGPLGLRAEGSVSKERVR